MRPIVKLGEICDILDKKRKPITQKDRTKGIYPYYGASGVLDYVADYIFDEDLVLIGEDGAKWGALDNSAFKVSGKVWVNNHAHVIRPHREKILDDYLVYYLVSTDLSDYITGTTVPKLNQERLKLVEIPLPPLETQKAIVAKLDQIFAELDQTKSEIQKNLDNTDELWKSALNQAFQGDWEMKKLGEIAKIYSGFPYNSSDFVESSNNQVLRLGNIKNDYIRADASPVFISDNLAKETQKCKCLVDDILVTLTGTRKKRDYFFTVRVSEDNNYFINQRVGIIRLNNVKYSRYINFLLKNEKILNQVFQYETGSANQGNLGNNNVLKIIIPVPPLSEQEKIVEHLDQVSKEVKVLKSQYQSQLDNLEELKKSVLDKAFRGELGE